MMYTSTGLKAMSFLYNAIFSSVTVKEFVVTSSFIFLNCLFHWISDKSALDICVS
jgi:hypothetical protein